MSVQGDERRFSAEREDLLDTLDQGLLAIRDIARNLDPSGFNAAHAKNLLSELRGVVDQLQANDHALSWTHWKLDLIGRCMLSDRPQ